MKHIRNWKIYQSNVELKVALQILRDGKTIGGQSPVAIQHNKTGKFVECHQIYGYDLAFKPDEIDNNWLVLVPDTDEEAKNEKIRNLMKDSCASGLKHEKIDNMTIDEIWQHISTHMDKDQKYRMLLDYYDKKIFKTK